MFKTEKISRRKRNKMIILFYRYNKIAGLLKKLVAKLKSLEKSDEYRIKKTQDLLDKVYEIGLIKSKGSLLDIDNVGISSFCRRRLAYLLFRNKYCETIKEAITFIEQGQVRVGTQVITDPAFLVTRSMEDHLTWTNASKIKRKIMEYNDKVDDYDMMN
jgi:U3 small nucleolar ribonucleoprotein protein IMP3